MIDFFLEVLGKKKVFKLPKNLIMGQHPKCQIHIPDSTLFPRHVKFSVLEGTCKVETFPGAEIFVNGKSEKKCQLVAGDHIRVGETVFRLHQKNSVLSPSDSSRIVSNEISERKSIQSSSSNMEIEEENPSFKKNNLSLHILIPLIVTPLLLTFFLGYWIFFIKETRPIKLASTGKKWGEKEEKIQLSLVKPSTTTSSTPKNISILQKSHSKLLSKSNRAPSSFVPLAVKMLPKAGIYMVIDATLEGGQMGMTLVRTSNSNSSHQNIANGSLKIEKPTRKPPQKKLNLLEIERKTNQWIMSAQYKKAQEFLDENLKKTTIEEEKRKLQVLISKVQDILKTKWNHLKKQIALEYKKQHQWIHQKKELLDLRSFFDHKSWAFRAIGVVAIGSLKDRRGLGFLEPALRDKNTMVRVFALKMLLRQNIDDIRHCDGVQKLIHTLIKEMYKKKLGKIYSKKVLEMISGETYKSKSQWKRWWKKNKFSFVTKIIPMANVSKFSRKNLRRYWKEKEQGATVRKRTVLRSAYIRSSLQDLRKNGLDVVICLDVTSSMSGVIQVAKDNLQTVGLLLRNIIKKFRIGLVTYEDRVTSKLGLTSSWNAYQKALRSAQMFGGADYPEGVDKALEVALKKMYWRKKATRVIVIVGDAPPHKKDLPTFTKQALLAKKNKISINAIYAIPSVVLDIEKIVQITGGTSHKLRNPQDILKSFLLLVFGKSLEKYLGDFVDVYLEISKDLGN